MAPSLVSNALQNIIALLCDGVFSLFSCRPHTPGHATLFVKFSLLGFMNLLLVSVVLKR